jgi:hypothetical protein
MSIGSCLNRLGQRAHERGLFTLRSRLSNLCQRMYDAPDAALSNVRRSLQALRGGVSRHVIAMRFASSSGVKPGTLHQKMGLT